MSVPVLLSALTLVADLAFVSTLAFEADGLVLVSTLALVSVSLTLLSTFTLVSVPFALSSTLVFDSVVLATAFLGVSLRPPVSAISMIFKRVKSCL